MIERWLSADSNWRFLRIAVVLAAAILFLVRLGDRAVVSEEMRWAEIAREMRQNGDWLHPLINGRTYYDKPVGSYWLIVAASYLTGGVNETAARLPAAIAGCVGVWFVMLLGRRLFNDRTALFAGAILATSFGFVFYSRRATADIETVTGVLIAIWFALRNGLTNGGFWVVALWIGMALVSLTKGLLGFALPLVIVGTQGLMTAWAMRGETWTTRSLIMTAFEQNGWLFNRWTLLAVPCGVVTYFLPFWLSTMRSGEGVGLAMVWRENIQRFVNPHNHVGPIYLYVGVIFVLSAPWALFLPTALASAATQPSNPGRRFAQVYFWAVFVFFTTAASRRSYYLLPVLPAASLLIAQLLASKTEELARWIVRFRSLGCWLLAGMGLLVGLLVLPPSLILPAPYDHYPALPGRSWLAVGWVTAIVVMFITRHKSRDLRILLAMLFVWLASLYGFGIVYPDLDDLRTRKEFLSVVRAMTDSDAERFGLFHASDIVFDLGRTALEFLSAPELKSAFQDGRIRWVITPRRRLAELTIPVETLAEEAMQPWESPDRFPLKLVLISPLNRPGDQP